MPKAKIFALVLIGLGVVSIVYSTYKYIISFRPTAGLKVTTNPPSQVFLDDEFIGKTPLEKYFQPGEAALKLIPDPTDSVATGEAYETKITLYPTVYTVVNREFSDGGSGEIITLSPNSGQITSFNLITSSPDSSAVTVDDQTIGLSPLTSVPLLPGTHKFSLTSPGFTPRIFTAQIVSGYNLQIIAKLKGTVPLTTPPPRPTDILTSPSLASPKPTAQAGPNISIKILSTPTGFLRLRQGPTSSSAEIGQVKPDAVYKLLQEQADWYLIQVDLSSTSSGWISSQYATKVSP